jgi:hypothetical protein
MVPSMVMGLAAGSVGIAAAQVATAPTNKHNTYGSPLDTLMSTRLWTDVAPAQDFVRATHPDARSLDYQPLTGTDPARPKPRDKANVEALQAELEHDGAVNATKGAPQGGARHPGRHHAGKHDAGNARTAP